MAKVKDVLAALDDLTGGRCLKGPGDWAGGKNPWVVTKSSDIPGKAVVEMPGLVWGDPEMEVRKIAVCGIIFYLQSFSLDNDSTSFCLDFYFII